MQPGSIVQPGTQAYGSATSATVGPAGYQQAWAGTLGTWVHAGIDATTPNGDHGLGQYGYNPGLASEGGTTALAWYSSAPGNLGVFAQVLAADASPLGAPVRMPNTGDMTVGMSARTPVVGVDGNQGYYVAYPTGAATQNAIRVWKLGSPTAALVGRASGNSYATVTITPQGQLWVAWTDQRDGEPVVLARRSNLKRTKWGEVVDVGAPGGSGSAYAVDGVSSENGDLYLFGAFSAGTGPGTATSVTTVEPGLTLTANAKRLTRGDEKSVRFTVRDAGDPVKGIRVKAGGAAGRTDKKGHITLRVTGHGRSMKAKASSRDYTGDSYKLRVRR